jgi:hypothetical protein
MDQAEVENEGGNIFSHNHEGVKANFLMTNFVFSRIKLTKLQYETIYAIKHTVSTNPSSTNWVFLKI